MAVKQGYKQTEVGVIPEEWEVRPFGALFTFRNGVNADKDSYGQGVRFINVLEPITYSHIHGPEIQGQVTLPESVSISYAVKLGDVLFNRTSETQEEVGLASTYLGSERVVFGGFVIRGRPTDGNLDPVYSGYALRAPCIRSQIIPMGQGAIRANIGQSNLSLVVAPVPPIYEQRAIATALSDVDALLDALERLIAKKRDLKQAAMQQLLTGQTRLPGFQGEWEIVQVQDVIFGSFCGPSPTCEERNIQDDSEWGVLKTTAATKENGWDWTKHKTLPRVFWNKPQIELRQGDVIVTKAGPRHRVGVAAWVNYVPPRIIPSGKMIALRPLPDKVVPLMLATAISARDAQTYLDQRTTGMAESQVNFENTALLEAPIRIPRIEEQTAIATVLSDMDAELAALEQRLTKTRALKQGMMRELLTGRTRLV
ncbi:restriction endonuclease subunit S [Pseudomonas saliphila]|uniref:restriction endonuclease subunit S n=1 Tax=Pseudomonas saliphila TaxID=2586906 RepID=UPI00123ABB61|nr:restriction endonuclease subunit S [Pseudomonas saliphila]